MPSFQARLIEKILQWQAYGWAKGSIPQQRARQEKRARFIKLPPQVHWQEMVMGGVAGELLQPAEQKDGLILYLHGGAYALGSSRVHREFLSRLAAACQRSVLALNYRLAPEHPFPAALQDALAAYGGLRQQGAQPAKIVIGGDSAGGGLALATLLALRAAGEELPACAFCLSPWVNLSATPSPAHPIPDPLLTPDLLAAYARLYAQAADPCNPLISPIFADLSGLPPLLIQVGTHEILLPQVTQLHENARQAGVDVTLEQWEGLFHVFQIVPYLPEGERSLRQIAEFVEGKLAGA